MHAQVQNKDESSPYASTEHSYRAFAWWGSEKTGLARTDSAPNAIHFTAPPQFGGMQGRWTPEDLLLAAIASCYTTSFRAIAEYSKLKYLDLGVEVEGKVRKADQGYSFGDFMIRPTLTIEDAKDESKAARLLEKAKTACLVSRALVEEPAFEPQVRVASARMSPELTEVTA